MDRSKIIVKTSIKAIIVNILLVIFKAIAGWLSNSIAIILDAVNNLSDAVSSIVTIVGAKLANKAPDKEHPYGHGRIEYIAAVFIALIILWAGLTSFKESVEKIINPADVNYSAISITVVTVAIFVKYFLARYVKGVGKKYNSQSLVASGTDAYFDSVIALSTLIAAIVNLVWGLRIEGYVGVLISVLIIKSGLEILKDTLNTVIGTRADSEVSTKLRNRINEFEEVYGTYDLILHSYGPAKIIGAANIQVDETMTARQIHGLTKKIQNVIYKEFGIILILGIYATNEKDEQAVQIEKDLRAIIAEYKEIIQLHGFYANSEKKTINFDIIIDFSADNPTKIKDEVIEKIKEKYPEYKYYVVIDSDFTD
ncbi:MAG: cation transporter [Clostridia bacterium]|nr:cation transporter [Clostridia bacterium]